jgi:hypothetical protein
MVEILGEAQGNGQFAFFGGEDNIFADGLGESNADSTFRSAVATPLLSSFATPNLQIDDVDLPTETRGEKRHRESSSLQTPHSLSKKQKASGARTTAEIGGGLYVLADAIAKKYSNMGSSQQTLPKDTVGSTLQGQALEKVQEESYLTMEGQAFMIEFLGGDLALARAYVAIKKDELRGLWLKKQIEKLGGDLEEHFHLLPQHQTPFVFCSTNEGVGGSRILCDVFRPEFQSEEQRRQFQGSG